MTAYPLTHEQEKELHERAARAVQRNPTITIEALIFVLGSHVFKDGRLAQTVSYQKCYEIAKQAQSATVQKEHNHEH